MSQTFLHSCSIYKALLEPAFKHVTLKTNHNQWPRHMCTIPDRHSLYLPGRFAPQLSKKIASYFLFSNTAHASSPFPLSADRCIPYSFEKIKANQPEPPRFPSGDRRAHRRVPSVTPLPRLHRRPLCSRRLGWKLLPLHHRSASI